MKRLYRLIVGCLVWCIDWFLNCGRRTPPYVPPAVGPYSPWAKAWAEEHGNPPPGAYEITAVNRQAAVPGSMETTTIHVIEPSPVRLRREADQP